jgi:hypothetical protein
MRGGGLEEDAVNNQIELAVGQIINRIEPLTRYGKDSLHTLSEGVRVTTGRAFWRFSPVISNDREEHTNRLPYHATRVDSSEKLDEVGQRTLQYAYQALPSRIQSWLRTNAGTDRKLEVSHCFDGPRTFGYEYKCSSCLGDGSVRCGRCKNASGYNDCERCSNKGHVDCPKCHSILWGCTGKEKCRGCGGSGKRDGRGCPSCNGKGKVRCGTCLGAKTITCTRCKGAGRLACSSCGATGRVACHPCKQTGYFHVLRTVTCSVPEHFRVDLKDPKSEVVRQLVGRDLESLRKLASVTQRPPTVRDNVVEREYEIECIITEIELQVAGKNLEVIGFGGQAQIFDFKNVVPLLLEADLSALARAVANTRLRLWGSPAELITTTSQFIDSEVNLKIDDSTLLRDKIIDTEYLKRVKTLLPTALGRILSANLGPAFLVTTLSLTATFLICHFMGVREMVGNWVFVAPASAAVPPWMLLERRARHRLRALLGDPKGDKVNGQLHNYYLLWKARALALALTLTLLAVAALLPLPTL